MKPPHYQYPGIKPSPTRQYLGMKPPDHQYPSTKPPAVCLSMKPLDHLYPGIKPPAHQHPGTKPPDPQYPGIKPPIPQYETVSRSGLAVSVRLVSRGTSVRICFGAPFSSKVAVCGHCLVTLSLTINETLKWLSSLPTLMQKSFRW